MTERMLIVATTLEAAAFPELSAGRLCHVAQLHAGGSLENQT
jgi:hypothetical protein